MLAHAAMCCIMRHTDMDNKSKQPRLSVPLVGKPREKLAQIAIKKDWSEAKTAVKVLTKSLKDVKPEELE